MGIDVGANGQERILKVILYSADCPKLAAPLAIHAVHRPFAIEPIGKAGVLTVNCILCVLGLVEYHSIDS